MTQVAQRLREEHREFFPHIDLLRQVADRVGDAPVSSLRKGVSEAYDFLNRHFLPHATAEDVALYPIVDRLTGSTGAVGTTATMIREHAEIVRMTDDLAGLLKRMDSTSLSPDDERALRRVLYGLHAVVKLHFLKEEEIYLPLLEAKLDAESAALMFERMDQVAMHARAHS